MSFPLTGIGRYTFELSKHLALSNLVSELLYLRGTNFLKNHSELGIAKKHMSSFFSAGVNSPLLVNFYQKISALRTGQALCKYPEFLYHGTSFRLPKFSGPKVVTIHDLSPFKYPECHPAGRASGLRKEIIHSIKTANAIIAGSKYTCKEIADFFGCCTDKIYSVPLAANPKFRPKLELEIGQSLRSLGIEYSRYSLFVGTIEPRKNLETLLSAYGALPQAHRKRFPLVIVGYHGWKSEGTRRRIEEAENEGWVKHLGFVTDSQLSDLFSGAKLFVFPSLYEGFGLPVLEAMASGVPVVCSDSSSLPEVASGCALLFNSGDADELKLQIIRGLEDITWRNSAIEGGLSVANSMSWARCAKQTIDVYQTIHH